METKCYVLFPYKIICIATFNVEFVLVSSMSLMYVSVFVYLLKLLLAPYIIIAFIRTREVCAVDLKQEKAHWKSKHVYTFVSLFVSFCRSPKTFQDYYTHFKPSP